MHIIIKICIILVPYTVLSFCFSMSPRKLIIHSNNIEIRKFIGKIIIPKEDIETIYQIKPDMIKNSIRIFGSGGFGGYLGKFRNSTIGNYQMYITEKKHLVLIKTKDINYVVNCRDFKLLTPIIK